MADITATPANNGIPGAIQMPPGSGATSIDENGVAKNIQGKPVGNVQTAPAKLDFFDQFPDAQPAPGVPTPKPQAAPTQAAPQQTSKPDFFDQFPDAQAPLGSEENRTQNQPEKPGALRRLGESVGITPEAGEQMAAHPFENIVQNSIPGLGAAQGIYEWGKRRVQNLGTEAQEVKDAYQNIRAGGPVGANIGKAVSGILEGETSSVPFIGEPTVTAGHDIADKNYRGAVGGLVGAIGQVVVPEVAPEIIGGVRGAISPEYGLKASVTEHVANSVNLHSAIGEADVASRQAAQTADVAQRARDAEAAGQGTRQQTIQAEETASQASANNKKAQQKLAEASDAQKESALKVTKAQRRLNEAQSAESMRQSAKTTKQVDEALNKVQIAYPPTARAPYTPEQAKIALAHIADDHATTPIKTDGDMVDALNRAEDKIDKNIEVASAPHVNQPITTNPINDVRAALDPANKIEAGWTEKGLKSIEDFNTTDMTIGEAQQAITRLNDQMRGLRKKNFWDYRTAVANSPEFAAKAALVDSLRRGVDGGLTDMGVPNTAAARSEQAAVINFREAVESKSGAGKGDAQIRGTSPEVVGFRKALGKHAETAGKVGGGSIGGGAGFAVGGPFGAFIGERLGEHLGGVAAKPLGKWASPADLTRNEIIGQAADVSKHVKTKLADVRPSSARPLPVDALPPEVTNELNPDEMRQLMREQTPLHAELASHYDQHVGDTSYRDLEQKFNEDITDKKAHGVEITPAEKKLQVKMNEQKIADDEIIRQGYQKAQETAQAEAAKPKPTATLPKNAEPIQQFDGPVSHDLNPREALMHDYTHAYVANEVLGDKLPQKGVRSASHPENDGNSYASVGFDWSNFKDEDGNMDPDKLAKHIDDIATVYVSGGVANDMFHGVPFDQNMHLGADMRTLQGLMNDLKILKKTQADIVYRAGQRAQEILSKPGVEQVLHDHAGVRESGLPKFMHASPERVQQIIDDIKGGESAESTKLEPATGVGKSKGNIEQNPTESRGSGVSGEPKGKPEVKLDEAVAGQRKGPSEDTGKEGQAVERGKPAEPKGPKFGNANNLTHNETERGGEIRLDEDGKNRGMLKYTKTGPDSAAVTATNLDPDYRGRGIGTAMYERAAEEARGRGIKTLTSDLGGQTSYDAGKTWDRLAKKYPGEITKVESKAGSPGYEWNLQKEVAEPANPRFEVGKPKFRSTGNEDLDRRITEAGGTPGGVMKGFDYQDKNGNPVSYPSTALVHHESGSSLNVPLDASVDHIKQQLDAKTAEYAAADQRKLAEPENPKFNNFDQKRQVIYEDEWRRDISNMNDQLAKTTDPAQKAKLQSDISAVQRLIDKSNIAQPESPKFSSVDPRNGGSVEGGNAGTEGAGTRRTAKEAPTEEIKQPENPKFTNRVSTRVPTAKPTKTFTPENHMGEEPLTVGRQAVDADPKLAQKLADTVSKYEGFKIPKGIKDPAKILDRFTTHLKDNLLHLYDSVEPEKQKSNAKWYESVNKKALNDGEEYGIEPRQAAGVYASLSPQKDWDMNADLARRTMDIHFNHADETGTPEMAGFGNKLVKMARDGAEKQRATFQASGETDPKIVTRKQQAYDRKMKNAADLESVVNRVAEKKYSDLTDPYEKGVWVRLYDETSNPRNYPKIDPGTGNALADVTNADGSKSKVAWGSMEPIARAVSILQDGSRENISNQLSGQHKVRNFYNNIIEPSHPQDVTIDTHAVAAAHMQPFSGQSKEVANNFGGAGKSAQTGISGSYPLYAEAYRQAAAERGVLPREMQSVTWEKIRELFPAEIKDPEFQTQAKKIWKQYSDGKISIDQARQDVTNAALEKRATQTKPAKSSPGTTKALDLIKALSDNQPGVAALGQQELSF